MEFEFDKEIDAILRKARTSETALADAPKAVHLDADDLSAFAENALPEKTKLLYTAHLADCARCRKILSNIISLNSEAEIENDPSAAATRKDFTVAPVPWYRKLFSFPQLTYVMGGLVMVFSGFLVYFVMQNSTQNADNSSISQTREIPINMKGASSDGEARTVELNKTSNTNAATNAPPAVSNSAAAMPNSMSNTASANSSAAPGKEPSTEREKDADGIKPQATPVLTENQSATGGTLAPPPPPPPPLQTMPSALARTQPEDSRTDDKSKQAAKEETEAKKLNKQDVQDEATADVRASQNAPMPKSAARKVAPAENRSVGGKNFTRRNGVWYDAAYNNQSTVNVSRGTDDYKKLDSGLRSIADNFRETVVIVWKSKAYRIQ